MTQAAIRQTVAHPIDFDTLDKGTLIPQRAIEDAMGVRQADNSDRFRLEQLRLRELIDRHRPDLVTRAEGECIRVLTDEEAEIYTAERHEKTVRDMRRTVVLRSRVDRSEFSELDRKKAECLDAHIARQAIETARRLRDAKRELLVLEAMKPKELAEFTPMGPDRASRQ